MGQLMRQDQHQDLREVGLPLREGSRTYLDTCGSLTSS